MLWRVDITGRPRILDLGDCTVGDRRDVARYHRSLRWKAEGSFGGRTFPDTDPDMLYDILDMEPDREIIRYYILLDELL